MSNDERFSQVVLGAVFDRLDSVFPEFGWRRSRGGWVASNDAFCHSKFEVRAERIICNISSGFYIHGNAQSEHWLSYLNGGSFPRGEAWHVAATELARRVGMDGFEKRGSAGNVWLKVLAAAREQLASSAGEALRGYCAGRDAPWQEWQLGGVVNLESLLERAGVPVVEARRQRVLTSPPGEEQWSGRIVGVVRDAAGEPVGMWGRNAGGAKGPRYLMSGVGAPAFFGRSREGRRLVVSEGYFDALRVADLGESAEALGGNGVAEDSLAAWRGCSEVVMCLDGDEAGMQGLKRLMRLLPRAEGLPPVSVVLLPTESDLDEVLGPDLHAGDRQDDGAAVWAGLLEARTPWLTFVVRAELEQVQSEGDEAVALRRIGGLCKASLAGWPADVAVALREAAKLARIDERFLERVCG